MRMTDEMQELVRRQGLGFVATVRQDGTPALSPKGTTIVWSDRQLVFLHLHSPGTVANLAVNPAIEINVIDPLRRKGFRFAGQGQVLTDGDEYERILAWYQHNRGTDRSRVHGAVVVDVTSVEELISPIYDTGATEAEVIARYRARILDDQPPRA